MICMRHKQMLEEEGILRITVAAERNKDGDNAFNKAQMGCKTKLIRTK